MKNIKTVIANESILSSTNSGKAGIKARIEAEAKKVIPDYIRHHVNDDLTVSIDSDYTIGVFNDVYDGYVDDKGKMKFIISNCQGMKVENNDIIEFTAPRFCKTLSIKDCPNLKKIMFTEETNIRSIIIDNCPEVEFDESIKNLKCNLLSINNINTSKLDLRCDIYSLLDISSCKKLSDVSLCHRCAVDISECNKLKHISGDTEESEIIISECRALEDIDLNVKSACKIVVRQCKKINSIKITGKTLMSLAVRDCESLSTLSVESCDNIMSLTNLPSLTTVTTPDKLRCTLMTKNTPYDGGTTIFRKKTLS